MNKQERIEMLCKMLGVELEEDFMLEGYEDNRYKITSEGLKFFNLVSNKYIRSGVDINYLLNVKVNNFPWKPKEGEKYYFLDATFECGYDSYNFNDSSFDEMVISRTEVYRTEKEAIEAVKEKGWVVD